MCRRINTIGGMISAWLYCVAPKCKGWKDISKRFHGTCHVNNIDAEKEVSVMGRLAWVTRTSVGTSGPVASEKYCE